jgi:hypothetical protein
LHRFLLKAFGYSLAVGLVGVTPYRSFRVQSVPPSVPNNATTRVAPRSRHRNRGAARREV